jgi:hypothetical protein
MLNVLRSRNKGCRNCSALNNPVFVKCMSGGEPYRFSYEGEDFELCRYGGFEFLLENANERNVLKKWIELELL